ncbi:MAG: GNAT family N-acetyltransferase, partial [Actinomycetota bacterium]|nr:GNAT family N-acetyltransferase [Actinomycetota bacterium]
MSIAHNEAAHRFEEAVASDIAYLDYSLEDDRVIIDGTEVPDDLEGHGLGGDLVQAAVDYAEANGLTVVAKCPFARGWLGGWCFSWGLVLAIGGWVLDNRGHVVLDGGVAVTLGLAPRQAGLVRGTAGFVGGRVR